MQHSRILDKIDGIAAAQAAAIKLAKTRLPERPPTRVKNKRTIIRATNGWPKRDVLIAIRKERHDPPKPAEPGAEPKMSEAKIHNAESPLAEGLARDAEKADLKQAARKGLPLDVAIAGRELLSRAAVLEVYASLNR